MSKLVLESPLNVLQVTSLPCSFIAFQKIHLPSYTNITLQIMEQKGCCAVLKGSLRETHETV